MSEVEFALLRNQILDYRDSLDKCESIVGQILHEQTDELDDICFVLMVRNVLDGLRLSLDRFDEEWKVDQNDR